MLLITEKSQAKYKVAPITDDGGDITFRFHQPRTTFGSDHRLSSLELKSYVENYMLGVICCGLLCDKPRVNQEFITLYQFLTTMPDAELDTIHRWIFIEKITEDDLIIQLNLRGKNPYPVHRPTGLVPGGIV
jgi:hypothetical protein